MLKHIATNLLDIAYDEQGNTDGWPVVLLHGFPYDIHAYDEVIPHLTSQGARVITPYLRGYGPTRFLASTNASFRGSRQRLAQIFYRCSMHFRLSRPCWADMTRGGRAACVVAALYPSRARGLVSVNGYNVQDIAAAMRPASPEKGASVVVPVLLS